MGDPRQVRLTRVLEEIFFAKGRVRPLSRFLDNGLERDEAARQAVRQGWQKLKEPFKMEVAPLAKPGFSLRGMLSTGGKIFFQSIRMTLINGGWLITASM